MQGCQRFFKKGRTLHLSLKSRRKGSLSSVLASVSSEASQRKHSTGILWHHATQADLRHFTNAPLLPGDYVLFSYQLSQSAKRTLCYYANHLWTLKSTTALGKPQRGVVWWHVAQSSAHEPINANAQLTGNVVDEVLCALEDKVLQLSGQGLTTYGLPAPVRSLSCSGIAAWNSL